MTFDTGVNRVCVRALIRTWLSNIDRTIASCCWGWADCFECVILYLLFSLSFSLSLRLTHSRSRRSVIAKQRNAEDPRRVNTLRAHYAGRRRWFPSSPLTPPPANPFHSHTCVIARDRKKAFTYVSERWEWERGREQKKKLVKKSPSQTASK